MSGNMGSGFELFQSTINMMAEALGPRTRGAISEEAIQLLGVAMGGNFWAARYDWTKATSFEFEEAARRLQEVYAHHRITKEKMWADADWQGLHLTARGLSIYTERNGYFLRLIASQRNQWRTQDPQWNVWLTDTGKRVLSGTHSEFGHASLPSSRNTKTEIGAKASMLKMVKAFFGVEMRNR